MDAPPLLPPVLEPRAYSPPAAEAPFDLDLSRNEGPPPHPGLLERLAGTDPERLRRYPGAGCLERLWAARLGVAPGQLLVTAGGDDAIDRIARTWLEPGRSIVVPSPTFEMIPRAARATGAEVRAVRWEDGAYPTDAVLAAADAGTAVIAVVSPNNPTGLVARAEDLRRLAAGAPRALLLVDLAYGEFADEDLVRPALDVPGAVILRTLSKAHGLAGLRVGCAVAREEIVSVLRAAGAPYAVSGPSLSLAEAIMGDDALFARSRETADRVRGERRALAAALRDAGLAFTEGQANFVLVRDRRARWLHDALLGLGIRTRRLEAPPGAVRVTCPGDPAVFERLEHAVATALRPEALLFDLDGVLADVSRSYRRAVELTARSFGVEVGPGDVAEAKRRGGANDDWELTHRLLAAYGVKAALSEVTERFEALYQGGPDEPGLRADEPALVPFGLLERLGRRLALGVVTGRPRRDARRWLEDSGLAPLFSTVVTREDAPLKPAPDPVRLACGRLGVDRAWMVGDTPDDVRAARGAGVVPLGVPAPGDDAEAVGPALRGAGAARVLGTVGEIEELLP